jgi:cell division protein FtsB
MTKNKKLVFKIFKNIFVLIFVVFAVWMLFFDTNSFLTHLDLNKEMDDLESEKEYYKREIEKDKKELETLTNDGGLEKFAREKYYMKRDNEEIYIIEYEDSIAKTTEDE